MLKCSEIPEQLTEANLSLMRSFQLRFHLIICKRCRALKSQFEAINKHLHRYVNRSEPMDPKITEKIVFNYLNKKD